MASLMLCDDIWDGAQKRIRSAVKTSSGIFLVQRFEIFTLLVIDVNIY